MGLESPGARAERMAGQVSIWGEVIPLEQTVAKIDAVTEARAREVLQRIIAGSPTLALYGPVDDAGTASDLAARLVA